MYKIFEKATAIFLSDLTFDSWCFTFRDMKLHVILSILILFLCSSILTSHLYAATACSTKSSGDADCKKDPNTQKDITLTDFEIWRKEFFAKCNENNLSVCGNDDDGDGNLMDADFDNLPEAIYNGAKGVSTSDFEIWRKGYFNQ